MEFQSHWNRAFLALLLVLGAGAVLPTVSYGFDPPVFDLPGDKTSCVANGMTTLTDSSGTAIGCVKSIAGDYTDSALNDFKIVNPSTGTARIEFIEGAINKLIFYGTVVAQHETITNAKISFKHVFTHADSAYATGELPITLGNVSRNTLSGTANLQLVSGNPLSPQRSITGQAFRELCTSTPTCQTTDGNPFTDPALLATIPQNIKDRQFSNLLDQQDDLDPGFISKPLLRGELTISLLRNTAIREKVSNIVHTITMANQGGLPPFDGSACEFDEDVGKIIRGPTADRDTICVKTEDGSFIQLPGPEALSLVSGNVTEVPTFEQMVEGLKFEHQLLKFWEKSGGGN